MDQLSDAWLEEWEKRVASNALAPQMERTAAQRVHEARLSGNLVRVYDEINLGDEKWRSSNVFPVEETGVRLEERAGPVSIERFDGKWAEARLRLDKLRLKDLDPEAKLLESPRLSELPDSPAEWADYEKLTLRETGKCSVQPGFSRQMGG